MVHRRIFLPVLVVSFFAASFGIVSALLYSNSKNTEIAFGHELQSVAQAIAKDIEPQEYYSLFFNKNGELRDLPTAPSSPVFEKYKTKLMQFRKTFDRLNLQHDNLYTFIVPPDLQTQRLYWGIMTHSVPFTGETYKATKTIRNVIENKVAAFSGIYLSTASNKEWVSGYAPIVYQNKVIGVVEVAREVSEVIQESEKNIILPIAISLGIILLFLIALVVILYFAKGLEQKNAELKIAFERINLSETLYRHLFNSGSNIHFALNEKLEMISTNTAFSREFRFSCDSKTHQSFLDLLKNLTPESQAQSILNTGFTESSIRALKRAGQKFEFTSTLVSGATNEAKDFQIIIEKVQDAGEVAFLGKAISLGESMVAGLLARQKAKYVLQNSLVHTEHLASHLATLARKFLSEDKSIVLRIVLREMLINAVEHGNLEISFDEKTEAMIKDEYFDMLELRKTSPVYSDRKVIIDSLISAEMIAFRITDEGKGFDHKGMLEKLQNESNETSHGRGIVMTVAEFDVVRYNAKGNSVTLILHLKKH